MKLQFLWLNNGVHLVLTRLNSGLLQLVTHFKLSKILKSNMWKLLKYNKMCNTIKKMLHNKVRMETMKVI